MLTTKQPTAVRQTSGMACQEANNAAAEGAEHSPAPLDDLPAQAQELVDNRSLPQPAHLDARTECHPRGKDEHRQRKAHRQQQHIVGRGVKAHIGVDLLHRHAQQRNDVPSTRR